MVNRSLAILMVSALMLTFYSCGGDNPTGSQSELESENSVISGLVNAMDDGGGIQDALLELSESNSVVQETYSDDNGEFSFTNVESGQYEVTMTLPQGYRESGTTSRTVQVDNDVSIEFEGEPIIEETVTVKAGEQDTVATASGAFVVVNASDVSSDMEVTISEMVDQNEEDEFGTQPVKIQIRPSGASKSSVSPAKRIALSTSVTSVSVDVNIGQKINYSGPASWVFSVESEDGIIPFYAEPEQITRVDPKTKKESSYFTHSISPTSTLDLIFEANIKYLDNSCDDDFRKLDPVSYDNDGEQALILVHGIQPTLGLCEQFNAYEPLNLDDDDEENNTFDRLVSKLLAKSEINDKYRLYTYKYPTNAPLQEASDDLWNQIEGNDQIQKPVILAHSMGGLVARKMVATVGSDAIRGLITLGTPHYGTPIANTAEMISNSIKDLCSSNSNLSYKICGAEKLNSGLLPNTPGLRDLRAQNVKDHFETSDIEKDKIFTFGGDLGSLDNISSNNSKGAFIVYTLGFSLMSHFDIANDGMVPLSSAVPDWSGLQAELYGHDHTEIVRGEDYDEVEDGSISSYLIPLLQKLIPTSINENSIYVSSAKTNFITTAPSDLYGVELSPEGQDLNIGRIETSKGEDLVITDIAKAESGELWGISWEDIYRIDRKTGFALRVGETGFESMNALEIDSNGRLLALTGNGSLIEINKQDGSGELISELQDNWRSVGDIAFGPDGDLFAVLEKGLENNVLATIEMNTGKVLPVNPDTGIDVGYGGLYGITFFKDTLYGLTTTTNGGNLLEINTSTGTGSKIRSLDFQASGAAKQ